MSTATLAEGAPVAEGPTDIPVDANGGEVAEDSVDSGAPDMVPADRFNGLMSTFNRTQAELEAERSRIAELEARLADIESHEDPAPMSTDISSLEAQVNSLTAMLVEERMENARAAIVQEFPEVQPFADLIVGNSPEDIRDMARTIADRVRRSGAISGDADTAPETTDTEGDAEPSGESAEAAPPADPAPEAPVAGGGAAYSGEPTANDRVHDAVAKRDFAGLIEAKWDQLAATTTGSLV